jgi:hypothetical protein
MRRGTQKQWEGKSSQCFRDAKTRHPKLRRLERALKRMQIQQLKFLDALQGKRGVQQMKTNQPANCKKTKQLRQKAPQPRSTLTRYYTYDSRATKELGNFQSGPNQSVRSQSQPLLILNSVSHAIFCKRTCDRRFRSTHCSESTLTQPSRVCLFRLASRSAASDIASSAQIQRPLRSAIALPQKCPSDRCLASL